MPGFRLRSLGDDRLGRLVAAGDERAFGVVYERHHQALYRYCRSIVGDPEDAADALQNTMAAALRGLSGEKREIRLKPWLFRIAHNECISLLRGRRPQVAIDDSLELLAPDGVDAFTRERLRQLVADLRELPEAQRGALVMRELSGLAYDDIAAALGGNAASARQAVFEARTALHELAEGRAMECESVRRALSDNDGRVLRGRKLRAHMRACGSCRDFRDLIGSRKRDLALIAPPIPAALAAGLLHHVVGGGAATASGGAGAGGAGLGSIAAGKAVAASTALKAAAIVAATAAVGAGTVETVQKVEQHSSSSSPAQKSAPAHVPSHPAHKTAIKHVTISGPGRSHHKAANGHHSTPSKGAPLSTHSHPGKPIHTPPNHSGGNSNGNGKSGDKGQATMPDKPDHPTTPTGKGDTPGADKGKAPTTPGPPATTPGSDKGTTTPTVPTPTLPDQAQTGQDRANANRGTTGLAGVVGKGLAKH
jgi:RNA polymerase sigma factor (sigma-70 family)